MAKTISEICIANTGEGTHDVAHYEAAGYVVHTDNKIDEFAMKLDDFHRDAGVLELLRKLLSIEHSKMEEVHRAERLLRKTRLFAAGEEESNE